MFINRKFILGVLMFSGVSGARVMTVEAAALAADPVIRKVSGAHVPKQYQFAALLGVPVDLSTTSAREALAASSWPQFSLASKY